MKKNKPSNRRSKKKTDSPTSAPPAPAVTCSPLPPIVVPPPIQSAENAKPAENDGSWLRFADQETPRPKKKLQYVKVSGRGRSA